MPNPQQRQDHLPSHAPAPPGRQDVLPVPFRCTAPRPGTGAAWLQASGELDIAVAPALDLALQQALSAFPLVVLDLDELTFIDVAGVQTIVDASVRAACDGQRLLIASPPDHVQWLIEFSGCEDAIEALDQPTSADPRAQA